MPAEPPTPIEITEVIRRADQGLSKPYVCRGENDQIYIVKSLGAGRRSLFAEWIAGHLGVAMGLPIAPFTQVYISPSLLSGDALLELGPGVAFGSAKRPVTEWSYSLLNRVPVQTKRDLLVFDWWVKNGDRNYTTRGGNPNLFWQPGTDELLVIDHNQAFDGEVDRGNFFDTHVFSDQVEAITNDLLYRIEYSERLATALEQWDTIVDKIPESWFFADNEMTVPADFDLKEAHAMLVRYKNNEFWDWL